MAFAADPQFIKLEDAQQFVSGGDINWEIQSAGGTEEKRLVPNGMMNKDCLVSGSERASMKLVPHPNPKTTDVLVLQINLTSKCQERRGNFITARGADVAPRPNPDDAASLDRTQSLSSFFQGIKVPAEFSGSIMVCAYAHGDKAEARIGAKPGSPIGENCSPLSALNDNGNGLVRDSNHIIGRGERLEAAAKAAADRRIAEQKEIDAENAAKMLAVMRSFGRSSCEGDIRSANGALARLAALGLNVISLRSRVVHGAVDGFKKDIADAADVEAVDEVLARFEQSQNFVDARTRAAVRTAAIDRKIKLLESRIADLRSADGGDASSITSDIKALREQVKSLMGAGKESKDKLESVEGLSEKMVNRSMALGSYSRAIELARAGASRTSGTHQELRYALAERRVLEKQFQACVKKYADKDSGIDRCSKVQISALRAQRNYEGVADSVGTEDEREQAREDRREIFGQQQGYVQTPFGPVYQQGSIGEMQAFQFKTMQDTYMDQMSMFGGGIMGGGSNLAMLMGLGGGQGLMGGGLAGRFNYMGGGPSQMFAGLQTPFGNGNGFPRGNNYGGGGFGNQFAMF